MSSAIEGTEARLQRWVEARQGFGAAPRVVAVRPLPGGQSSDMLRFTCRDGDGPEQAYVVRREPRAKQLFLKPDVTREYRIIEGVGRAGTVPVPPLLGVEPDESVLGAPFFVMREVEGFVPLGRPSLHVAGPLCTLAPALRRTLWSSAMDALVGIHAIDWRRHHDFLADELGTAGALDRHVRGLERWYEWTAKGRAFDLTDKALAYLIAERHRFDNEPTVLLWSDARVGNIMFRPDGKVAAVLDWEGATLGPPGQDVGYWMMMDGFQAEAIGVPRLEGWPSEAETLARYEAASGRRIADIDYFIVMAAFFIATTLIRQADIGAAKGSLPGDTRMGHDNSATQMIAQRLGLPVPELSPDFIRHRQLDRLAKPASPTPS